MGLSQNNDNESSNFRKLFPRLQKPSLLQHLLHGDHPVAVVVKIFHALPEEFRRSVYPFMDGIRHAVEKQDRHMLLKFRRRGVYDFAARKFRGGLRGICFVMRGENGQGTCGWEIKSKPPVKTRIPLTFRKACPDAETGILTPENYDDFLLSRRNLTRNAGLLTLRA